jgi:hypothetical protein
VDLGLVLLGEWGEGKHIRLGVIELMEQGSSAFEAAMPVLSQLLKAETAEREVRSIAYQLKAARFATYKDLAGFDFAASEVNEALVRQLHRCESMDSAYNIVLIGGPGTGKTHVARLSVFRLSSITARRSGSSPPSNSSMPWNRKGLMETPASSPNGWSSYPHVFALAWAVCGSNR